MTTEICSTCWYDRGQISYNVNGRCDSCNGVTWVDPGEFKEVELDHWQDITKEIPRPELKSPQDVGAEIIERELRSEG